MVGKYVKIVFAVLTIWSVVGCTSKKRRYEGIIEVNNPMLICRKGKGVLSSIISNFNSNHRFSHIGIVIKEGDSSFVYHSEANEFTGVGGVKREWLYDFIDNSDFGVIYKFVFSDSVLNEIKYKCWQQYEAKKAFDLDFDLSDTTEFYCSEFVGYCVNIAVSDSLIKPSLKLNGKIFLNISDCLSDEVVNSVFYKF